MSPRPLRSSHEQPLKAVIEEFLGKYRLHGKLNETRAIQAWEKVVGALIARNTTDLHIRNKTLYVKVNSSALRNELLYARTKIISAINKEVGAEVITEMVMN
jgi:predicted nucleic acid-binding Zn ribbon protein